MLRFASLGSGSKGNATLIECGQTRVLVDCGFGLAETEKRLLRLGVPADTISAILVTHEHGDHANGVGKLSRRHRIPVWTTYGTRQKVRDDDFFSFHAINIFRHFAIGDLEINPFPVPHDAREPCQFVFSDGAVSLGLLTDAGSYTPHILEILQQLDGLLLECNYDAQMLARGPYPPSLKSRVGGKFGHMDNKQAESLLRSIDQTKLQHLVGMHLSEKNNQPDHANSALCAGLGCEPGWISLADQDNGFDWREIR